MCLSPCVRCDVHGADLQVGRTLGESRGWCQCGCAEDERHVTRRVLRLMGWRAKPLEVVDADVVRCLVVFVFDGGDGEPEGMEDAAFFGFDAYLAAPRAGLQ